MTTPAPGSAEWLRIVTASKVPAILGLSPWQSPYSLWMEMTGRVTIDHENRSTERGNLLEPAVLEWWETRDEWRKIIERQKYVTHEGWAGATLDALAMDADALVIVEAKTAAYRDGWGTPGTDEIPEHYKAQVHWQLAMYPDADAAHVAVLFGQGLEFAEYTIMRNPVLEAQMVRICHDFHTSLGEDTPPPLDDTVPTWEAVRRLHPEIDGETTDVDPDVAREYIDAHEALRLADARARLAKSTLATRMGTARIAALAGEPIARRQPTRNGAVSLVQIKTGTAA